MLSNCEEATVLEIEDFARSAGLLEKSRRYDTDIRFLISLIRRLNIVETLTAEEKLELKQLQRLQESVIKFGNEIGLYNSPTG